MPENITKKTMRISVVGAGKIAHSLVPALQAAGYIVNAVFSKTERSAVELAEKFNIGIFSNDLSALPNNSSLIFFLVTGANKAQRIAEIMNDDEAAKLLPAYYIEPKSGTLIWYLDEKAASKIS